MVFPNAGARQLAASTEVSRGSPADVLINDLRSALRIGRNSPGFATVAVLTLTLRIFTAAAQIYGALPIAMGAS